MLRQPRIYDFDRFALPSGSTVVGRNPDCAFRIPDRTISRHHAELFVYGSVVTIRDLESHNGTFVDDARIETMELRIGGCVRFGRVAFTLVDEDVAPACAPPSTLDCELASPEIAAIVRSLTLARRRVFDLLLCGQSEKQIANQLGISRHTAHNHVRDVYAAFAVHSRAELLARALPPPGDGGIEATEAF